MASGGTAFVCVTPLVPAGADLDGALAFYTRQLGFTVSWKSEDMAGIYRNGVSFHLVRNSNRVWADNCSCSIGVADLDALYDEYRSVEADVGTLDIKPWGRREFHLIVASGVCLQFYEHEV